MDDFINFLDLKKQYIQIKEEISKALSEVCESTAFSDGSFVKNFENEFARYCNSKFAVGLNSGTSALHLAMLALNIKAGDEVIVPANSFIATVWGPLYVGATPVFVDCDPDTWNIDVSSIENKINNKTRAIIGVHLYGQPFDIEDVLKLCKKYNIFLVEDCAQSAGSKYKDTNAGTFGKIGCFSFYPGKNLGAYGDAGALITNINRYDSRIRSLKNHGSVKRYYHDEIGYNMRMSGFQGAVLSIKLKYLDAWNKRRREIASLYHYGLKNPKIKFQFQPEWSESNYHLFVITTQKREELLTYLSNNNVHCGMHYPVPCHLQKALKYLGYKEGDFPNSEYLADHCLSLPMYSELTDKEIERVISLINKY